MTTDNHRICELEREVTALKERVVAADKALTLAHNNTLAWAIAVVGWILLIVTVISSYGWPHR